MAEVVDIVLTRCWRRYALVPHFHYNLLGGCHLFKSGIESPAFNYSLADERARSCPAEKVASYFGKTPFTWILRAPQPALREELSREQFKPRDNVLGMVLDLRRLETEHNDKVIRVTDSDRLLCWTDIVSRVFAVAPNETKRFAEALFRLSHQGFFLAYHNNKPAAASLISIEGREALLSFVATLPENRKRGLGGAVSGGALLWGKGLGCQTAALQSSALGKSVYRRLGFKKTANYELWA